MSKQINFFIFTHELTDFESEISKLDFEIIYAKSQKKELSKPEKLSEIHRETLLFVLSEHKSLIEQTWLDQQKVFWINPMQNPAIEFRPAIFNEAQNSLTPGRLHLSKKNIDPDIYEAIKESSNKIFIWFKNHYKKNKINDYYISDLVYEKYKIGAIQLQNAGVKLNFGKNG